jgi:hypothetical protein
VSGSTSALIVIPIVAVISLAPLLIMVFYADSHPPHGPRTDPAPRGGAMSQSDTKEFWELLAELKSETSDIESRSRATATRAMQLLVLDVAIAGIVVAGWLVVVQIRLQVISVDQPHVPRDDVALTRAGLWGLGLAAGLAVLSGVFAARAWRRGDHGGTWDDDEEGTLAQHVYRQLVALRRARRDARASNLYLSLAAGIFGPGILLALLAALVSGLI